jgi:hypothetical protein
VDARKRLGDLDGAVGGLAVNHQDFVRRAGLLADALQRIGQEAFAVAHDDHGADC